jgi:hypothetical protein
MAAGALRKAAMRHPKERLAHGLGGDAGAGAGDGGGDTGSGLA